MQLLAPTIEFQNEYLNAVEEGKGEMQTTRLAVPAEGESFVDFVNKLNAHAQGLQLPQGWVRSTELWLIDNNQFIGRVSIRHSLTEHLLKEGGHIGYYIRPSKREKGYGNKILALSLPEAKRIGLNKVLVTCDDDNPASQKIIEANRGILENIVEVAKDQPKIKRYWISLN